jgi:hypothetical protein
MGIVFRSHEFEYENIKRKNGVELSSVSRLACVSSFGKKNFPNLMDLSVA